MATQNPNQIHIQNALRALTCVMPKESTLRFEGGDIVTLVIEDNTSVNTTPYADLRTQDAAQILAEKFDQKMHQCANPNCDCQGSCAANWPEPPVIKAPRLAEQSKAMQAHDPKMSDCPNGAHFNINQRVLWSPGLLGASIPGRVSALIPVTDGAPTYQIRLDHVADKPDTTPGPLIDVPQDGSNGTLVEEPTTSEDTE